MLLFYNSINNYISVKTNIDNQLKFVDSRRFDVVHHCTLYRQSAIIPSVIIS